MKSLETVPHIRQIAYAAPMNRQDALSEGDWERAYTLACREAVVEYLAAPPPVKPSANPRKRHAKAAPHRS
ncbi:MAG: hypothetical protein KY468_16450 [Armatimonadetes bacterium]|nr:hypothetical protein [Armatimonadota bacterium]